MNIFIREMKVYAKSIVLWCIGMLFMIVSGMGKFSYYAESGKSMKEIISKIPKTLRAILGFQNFDVTKVSGFYGVLFLYILIMAVIHASMLGANIIAKEERDKTAEFLMVKPVSRNRIITSKLLAALANVLILNIVTLVLSVVIVGKYSGGERVAGDIIALMSGMLILQVLFLSAGAAIASANKNPRNSASIASFMILTSFVLYIAADMSSKLEFLKYITPFKYFDAQDIIYGKGLSPAYVILSFAVIAVLVCITYIFYNKRDLFV